MSQTHQTAALQSLAEWWASMGVPHDEALMRSMAAAVKAQGAAPAQSGAATKPRASSTPGVSAGPAPRRRGASQTTPDAWAATAMADAAACTSHAELVAAIEAFDGCPLKESANSTVVFDGVPGAPVMVIGEGPGRDEDRAGRPFVGRAGQLLDRMLASIGIDRSTNALITNVNYWRPPKNRNPEPDELKVCAPFVRRMIALNAPRLIIAAGAVPAKALLGTASGIMKLRGSEHALNVDSAGPVPLFPIFHPAYLLRRPEEKARAWRDLLTIEQRLAELRQ